MIESYKNTMGFFRDKMKKILSGKKTTIEESTEFYVVDLLTKLSTPHFITDNSEALALLLAKASEAKGTHQRFVGFKALGDQALLTSGFFGDSLKEKIVDVDYYIHMGSHAYHVLSSTNTNGTFSNIFTELAVKFHFLVDALAELSEELKMTSNEDLLRMYDRWVATKSDRLLKKLREEGLDPFQSKEEKKLH